MTTLRGGLLIDGTGADPREADVEFRDGIIVSASSSAPLAHDDLDVEGLTVLPGLIDAHTHLGIVDTTAQPTGTMPAAVLAAHVFRNCELALQAGFTTVRDVGGVDGGVARALDAGLVEGPRLLPSGPILCQTGGHGDFSPPFAMHHHGHDVPGLVRLGLVCDGPDGVRRAARDVFRRGATQLKVCVSGGVVSLSDSLEDTQFSVDELRAAVEEARARDTYVTAHAHGLRGILNAIEAGIECIEHGTYLDEKGAARMAERGVAMVPTFTVVRRLAAEWREWGIPEEAVPRLAGVEDAMANATKLARDAGVVIGSGSDLLGPMQRGRGLELPIKAGILGPMEAIVSATQTSAKILRLDGQVGTVEAGKAADLIAVSGDPLTDPGLFEDAGRILLVVKGGRIVKDAR